MASIVISRGQSVSTTSTVSPCRSLEFLHEEPDRGRQSQMLEARGMELVRNAVEIRGQPLGLLGEVPCPVVEAGSAR